MRWAFLSFVLSTSASWVPPNLPHSPYGPYKAWHAGSIRNLITFGDSYTDESGLDYFGLHNGSAPPVGTLLPESFTTAGGGRTWARYVVQYTGKTLANGTWDPYLTLHDYAVAGASCSHAITPRFYPAIHMDFPPVLEYQVPAYQADIKASNNSYSPQPTADNSVYVLWIGTNDLGVNCFLTDSQVPGKVLADYTNCVYQVYDELYQSGARKFVLINTAPLELAPLYANASLYGVTAANSTYWPDKPSNLTAISVKMHQFTTSVNDIFRYQTPFETKVANRYPEAAFALFDVHSLLVDIYTHPADYLNGTEPLDVTGAEHECDGSGSNCVYAYNGASPDSFMWYDSLHPSEQTDRVIARNFVEVLNGVSKYATYY